MERYKLYNREISLCLWGGQPLSGSLSVYNLDVKDVTCTMTLCIESCGLRFDYRSIRKFIKRKAKWAKSVELLTQTLHEQLRLAADEVAKENKVSSGIGFSLSIETTYWLDGDFVSIMVR